MTDQNKIYDIRIINAYTIYLPLQKMGRAAQTPSSCF